MLPNIVLIGFMGCGKSSVGRRLASLTGHRLADSDDLIVHSENLTISEIFSLGGEDAFRNIEEKILADLIGMSGLVLATGGGAILRETNRATMKKIGAVAWLDADPDVLFERATRSNRRPLLQTPDPRKTFDDLMASRQAIYGEVADFRIDSTGLAHEQVARNIIDQTMRLHEKRTLGSSQK